VGGYAHGKLRALFESRANDSKADKDKLDEVNGQIEALKQSLTACGQAIEELKTEAMRLDEEIEGLEPEKKRLQVRLQQDRRDIG
jgi:septal ring factor EnvC (AmiA/AmiB activator)